MIDLLYFSWIRERIGTSGESIETRAETIVELIEELKERDVRYSEVFSDLSSFRVAINQELASFDASIIEAKEIAFFPPMTGG
jgi:molybdopterin synthase sulfur carrier subunit|tara:strand:+ start:156 stop:404 length:249 start_codon:yes stop_codon:yes gene_type:complete